MIRAILIAGALLCVGLPAQAQHFDNDGRIVAQQATKEIGRKRSPVNRSAARLLPHPIGCPRIAFCGCGAAVEIFGKPIRSLWLARAWYRFPKANPAPGMVAVRKHHVFVLKQHVGGNRWLAVDHNSGARKSRLHVRSIAGLTIVNPHARALAAL